MLCKCGCGGETDLAKKTDTKRGRTKGAPLDYLRGHHRHVAPPTLDGIFSRCSVTDTGCWEFQGARTSRGYGQIQVDGVQFMIHRFVYSLVMGTLTDEIVIRHRCDNPPCCNPKHLEAGSLKDNSNDALVRGRFSTGESHYNAKISDEQAAELRVTRSNYELALLAAAYGIDYDHARAIRSGRRRKIYTTL